MKKRGIRVIGKIQIIIGIIMIILGLIGIILDYNYFNVSMGNNRANFIQGFNVLSNASYNFTTDTEFLGGAAVSNFYNATNSSTFQGCIIEGTGLLLIIIMSILLITQGSINIKKDNEVVNEKGK